ncbi:hypothetical protein R3W88_017190 [Solanum pinnatisectum]|uniref:Uncharacterized protein n=1 Tax=Solanum pinnatisectum TaxID=50273 RepID=A0AAV9KZI0_9SOLN|nr:hypothetical protein R3W88_017190 [Solanum pinnatisectum]
MQIFSFTPTLLDQFHALFEFCFQQSSSLMWFEVRTLLPYPRLPNGLLAFQLNCFCYCYFSSTDLNRPYVVINV